MTTAAESPTQAAARRRTPLASWRALAGLALICSFYLVLVHRGWDPALLGYYHDDTLYLTAGQALARGEGPVLPSVPGKPAQTKYPPGLPVLLSAVWLAFPEFPQNLPAFIWLMSLIGCAAVAACFATLRQLGAGAGTALGLTAAAALHPPMVTLGGMVMSDLLFMALSLWGLYFAAGGLAAEAEPRKTRRRWLLAAAFCTAACLVRTLGVGVAAGAAAAACWRRRWRQAAMLFAPSLLAIAGVQLWSALHSWQSDAALRAAGGYERTLLFYTSYVKFWLASIPDWSTFRHMLSFNTGQWIRQPGAIVFQLPLDSIFGGMVAAAVTAGVVKGAVTKARQTGWLPLHFAFLFYSPIVLLWNYALMERFLLLFLPAILLGAWTEFSNLARGLRKALASGAWTERAAAAVLAAALAALAAHGVRQYARAADLFLSERFGLYRQQLAPEKREAYQWIRDHTSPRDVFIAYEDGLLYLHTGRRALRPLAVTNRPFYLGSEEELRSELKDLSEVARTLGASYWLVSADDFGLESAEEVIFEAQQKLLEPFEVVFESTGGRVRIHRVSF